MENVFDIQDAKQYIARIHKLTPETKRLWGKMTVDQALAHLNVPYGYIFEPEKYKKPGLMMKWILRTFFKRKVVSETPWTKNLRTAPDFVIIGHRDFNAEQKKLIANIQKVQQLGADAFDGKENFSFGRMSAKEWSNMMAKHLNHHLEQFGV